MPETENLSLLVRQQIDEILGSVEGRQRYGLVSRFTPEHEDRMDWMEKSIRGFQNDYSLGRVMSGPTWISGTSVIDGSITADKLIVNSIDSITINTGDLNVTGDIVAAASFPAVGARIVLNSSGLWGYSGGVTTTFKLNTDGSGEIGTAPNPQISWTAGGVVTIPKAIIGALTIADVGSGVIGGTYQSGVGTTRFEMSPTAIVAYASGIETFRLSATTGAMTATGSFTVKSAASGAHVTIDNAGGIAGYNATTESSGNRTFRLNAATGDGHLGSVSTGIGWDSAGTVTIGGVALSGGKITANHLSVSSLSAINANMGTLTSGSITGGTITANTITTGTLLANRISGGSVGGDFSLGTSDVTVNSTGRLNFGVGDYLANDMLHFEMAGSESGKIDFGRSGFTATGELSGFVTSTSVSLNLKAIQGSSSRLATVGLNSGSSNTQISLASQFDSSNWAGYTVTGNVGSSNHSWTTNGTVRMTLNATDFTVSPGGTARFRVTSAGGIQISTGTYDSGATSVSTVTAAWTIFDVGGGIIGYIPIYASYA